MKKIPDLNCDLGENESPSVTASLMRLVTSANIACGGHAGDLTSMQRCLRLSKKHNVRAGAHPGLPDKTGFGRAVQTIHPGDFETMLCSQISCLETLAHKEGVRLHHVKLHGALYQMVEKEETLGRIYLDLIHRYWPKLAIRSIAGGKIVRLAGRKGFPVNPELFADRNYLDPVTLVPRSEAQAVLSDCRMVEERVRTFLSDGTWPLSGNRLFRPQIKTLCVHGDTPGALALLRKLKKLSS